MEVERGEGRGRREGEGEMEGGGGGREKRGSKRGRGKRGSRRGGGIWRREEGREEEGGEGESHPSTPKQNYFSKSCQTQKQNFFINTPKNRSPNTRHLRQVRGESVARFQLENFRKRW